jgi:Outer membrane protein beta-barrel domain
LQTFYDETFVSRKKQFNMLKNTLKVILFTIIFSPSFAQFKPKTFEFGPKIGLNVTTVVNFDPSKLTNKLALNYQGGVFARYNNGKFSIQPELIYQTKGATYKTDFNKTDVNITSGVSTVVSKTVSGKDAYKYVSVPVLFGFSPLKNIYLETGPEFSWALNKGKKVTDKTIFGPDKATDKGWIIGTRINMLDALSLFSLNIRYTQGLTNVSNTLSKVDGLTPLILKNRALQVSVTYTFSEYYSWKKKYGIKKK